MRLRHLPLRRLPPPPPNTEAAHAPPASQRSPMVPSPLAAFPPSSQPDSRREVALAPPPPAQPLSLRPFAPASLPLHRGRLGSPALPRGRSGRPGGGVAVPGVAPAALCGSSARPQRGRPPDPSRPPHAGRVGGSSRCRCRGGRPRAVAPPGARDGGVTAASQTAIAAAAAPPPPAWTLNPRPRQRRWRPL